MYSQLYVLVNKQILFHQFLSKNYQQLQLFNVSIKFEKDITTQLVTNITI